MMGITLLPWVFAAAMAGIFALLVQKYVLFAAKVVSHSMEPALAPGDRLLAVRLLGGRQVRLQDIVVFRSREFDMPMVKRAVGLAGDLLSIQSDGAVYRNGSVLPEAYVHFPQSGGGAFAVPQNHLLLMGDNRPCSTDARSWKEPFTSEKDLLGRAVFRYYPLCRMGPLALPKQK